MNDEYIKTHDEVTGVAASLKSAFLERVKYLLRGHELALEVFDDPASLDHHGAWKERLEEARERMLKLDVGKESFQVAVLYRWLMHDVMHYSQNSDDFFEKIYTIFEVHDTIGG